MPRPTRSRVAATAGMLSVADAAPAGPPLKGCSVAVSGSFPGHTHYSIQDVVQILGGAIPKTVTRTTTHVICSEDDYKNGSAKVDPAKGAGITLVSLEWLLQCQKENKRLDEADFSWATAQSHSNGAASGGAATGKKRPIVVANPDADDQKPSKKTKGAKPTNKAAKANGQADAAAVDGDDAAVGEEVKKEDTVVADGQFIKRRDIAIPLDEYCPFTSGQVYVDPTTGLIYDASLNQSNSSRNNNKFYRIQIVFDPHSNQYHTWTRWGRVGESGQSATLGAGHLGDAIKQFEKKFRDKSGLPWDKRGEDPRPDKYAFVERSYDPDSDDEDDDDAVTKEEAEEEKIVYKPPECTLEPPVQRLMELIFNQQLFQATMLSLNYDAAKLPLGKLSKAAITRGFQQLKDLAALMNEPSLASSKWDLSVQAATEHLSNTYYSFIPHDFRRNRPPIINDSTLLKTEIELLESLSDMKDATDIMKIDKKAVDDLHPLDRQFQGLNLQEMTTLSSDSNEFQQLERYLNITRGSTHHMNYNVQQIFRIERKGETDRFNNSPYAKMRSDRRLLWHGSRCTNFGGILSQGLRIAPPEAPVSGYMFGKGIYLADMSSKSANYCVASLSNNEALLLLCEAELGAPMQRLTHSASTAGEDAKRQGLASTWGMGRTGPSRWVDGSLVHESLRGISIPDTTSIPGDTKVQNATLYYNEYICYDVSQVKLRYLFRVKVS